MITSLAAAPAAPTHQDRLAVAASDLWGCRTAPDGSFVADNFLRWFGDSKVANKDAGPRVVYHGTTSDFSRFYVPPRAKSMAAYFTDSPSYAAFYTRGRALDHEGGQIMPVYLRIKHPFRVQDEWAPAEWPNEPAERRKLIAKGHDGIVWTDPETAETMWIAFRPEQIKSAIGNSGAFDPESNDLTDSQAWVEAEADAPRERERTTF